MSEVEIAKSLLADGFEFSGPVPEPLDADRWIGMQKKMMAAFPDRKFNVEDLHLHGDEVHCSVQVTSTHTEVLDLSELGIPSIPATGKTVSLPREDVTFTFAGDKIASIRTSGAPGSGVAAILSQLGVEMPA
jgi:predicted ester cyclase